MARILLESGSPDGYQLEDASGVLLIEQAAADEAALRSPGVAWNPYDKDSDIALSNDGLTATDITAGGGHASSFRATAGRTTGKWYFEVFIGGTGSPSGSVNGIGLSYASAPLTSYVGYYGWGYWGNGQAYFDSVTPVNGCSVYASGDVIGVAWDADAGTISFYKNNTIQGASPTRSALAACCVSRQRISITTKAPLTLHWSGDSRLHRRRMRRRPAMPPGKRDRSRFCRALRPQHAQSRYPVSRSP